MGWELGEGGEKEWEETVGRLIDSVLSRLRLLLRRRALKASVWAVRPSAPLVSQLAR